jgi:hypothetical protein
LKLLGKGTPYEKIIRECLIIEELRENICLELFTRPGGTGNTTDMFPFFLMEPNKSRILPDAIPRCSRKPHEVQDFSVEHCGDAMKNANGRRGLCV